MTVERVDDETGIDLHAKLAWMTFLLGILISIFYYVIFNALGVVNLIWKWVIVTQFFTSIALYIHFLLNRKSRRLWVEGIVAPLALVPYLIIGLIWLFYFLYAPMSQIIRIVVLIFCFGVLLLHSYLVFNDFRRATEKEAVIGTIYWDKGGEFILRDSVNAYIDHLTTRTPFKKSFMMLAGYLPPFAAAFGLNINHVMNQEGAANVACIVLSALGFPLTVWIIGNACVRSFYFRVYWPLKIERETGKRVILGP